MIVWSGIPVCSDLSVGVFEMSRTGACLGPGMSIVDGDLAALVHALVENARSTHPETSMHSECRSHVTTIRQPPKDVLTRLSTHLNSRIA